MAQGQEYDIFELVGKSETNLRKLMSRTVEAYPPEWLIVHEAIQNARDAIQKCGLTEGIIEVVFDLTNQAVSVKDNGCGFNPDINLLGIGGTDKEHSDWTIQGNQGVGLKAVLLSTSDFRLESVNSNKKWIVTCNEAFKYKQGKEVKIKEHPIVETREQNGTVLFYKFPDKRVSDLLKLIWSYGSGISQALATDNLSKMKTAIEWYFRSYSYAGDVNRLLGLTGIKPIQFKVKLIFSTEVPTEFDGQLKDLLPRLNNFEFTFPNIQWNIFDSVNRVEKGKPKPAIISYEIPDGGKFTGLSSNVIWTTKYTKPEEYRLLLRNSSLLQQPNVGLYEELFRNTLGIYIAIGSLEVVRDFLVENPRRFVAANGIPSSHFIRDPTKGGELTYNRNIHFIINVNAKLNYGKQNITNTRMLSDIYNYYTDVYRATLKNIAKSIVGTEFVDSGGGGYFDRYADKDTNILLRPVLPFTSSSIKRIPMDENAVIALFYDLIGRGILQGYASYSLHGKSRYDARMMIKHSGMQTIPTPQVDNDLAVVEFKQSTKGLIDDFENDKKIAKEIHLLVAWENDFDENTGYQVVDIEYTPDDARRFFGVKKCLKDKMSGWHIQMLILKDFLQGLT